MALQYAVIRGEDNLFAYCQKRFKAAPRFRGCFAPIDSCAIELIYAKSPADSGYTGYYILTLPARGDADDLYSDTNIIRTKVYDDIRNGRVALLNG